MDLAKPGVHQGGVHLHQRVFPCVSMCFHVFPSVSRCFQGRRGFTRQALEPNVHISGPRPSKTPPKFNERTPPREGRKNENCGGGKRERHFGPSGGGGSWGKAPGSREEGPGRRGPRDGGVRGTGGPREHPNFGHTHNNLEHHHNTTTSHENQKAHNTQTQHTQCHERLQPLKLGSPMRWWCASAWSRRGGCVGQVSWLVQRRAPSLLPCWVFVGVVAQMVLLQGHMRSSVTALLA